MQKIILAYVPVLHNGYKRFFEKYSSDAELYILGQELIDKFDYLAKEIRALNPELIKKSIESWGIFENTKIADSKILKALKNSDQTIIMPNEDIMRELAAQYFADKEIIYDDVFLRWDKHNTTKEFAVTPNITLSEDEFDKKMILMSSEEGNKSSDWWRRMGAIIIKDGEIIISCHNHHVPSKHTCYANGDPRNGFHKGDHLELSTSFHAEATAIAIAAQKGICLEGASIYTTTFPCPPCAKLIAYSGIKKIYFTCGYGVLDGESILKQNGVKIIYVKVDIPESKGLGDIAYKK